MAGDVSVLLDLDAKQLYNELQQVQNHIVSFAKHGEEAGGKAGHGFVSSLKNAFSGVGDVFSSLKNVLTSTAGLLGIGIGAGALIAEGKSVVEFGSHIEDLSRRTGVNAEVLSRWGFAAQKAGTDVDALAKFIGFLEVTREKAARGDTIQLEHYKNLGVTAQQIRDPLLSVSDILLQIGKGNLNAFDFKAVGGKGALEVRDLVHEVGTGAIALDKSISSVDTKKLKELSDAFIDLKNSVIAVSAPIITHLVPALEKVVEVIGRVQAVAATPFEAITRALDKTPQGAAAAPEDTALAAQIHAMREKSAGGTLPAELADKAALATPKPEPTSKFSYITDEADDIAEGGKQAKKDAKAAAKEALDRETADLDAYYAQDPGALTPKQQEKQEEVAERDEKKNDERQESKQRKQDVRDEKFEKNPTGLSLHELATKAAGKQGSDAREAEREEALAKQLQLQGNVGAAAQHQSHAEQLKKSLGLPSKEDQKDSVRDGINDSQVMKDIRDNTKGTGANK